MKAQGSMGLKKKKELNCSDENVKNGMNPCDMQIQVYRNLCPNFKIGCNEKKIFRRTRHGNAILCCIKDHCNMKRKVSSNACPMVYWDQNLTLC